MTKVIRALRTYNEMVGLRSQWEDKWEEVARFILPRKQDIIGFEYYSKGQDKHRQVYDSVPEHANEIFASSLHGMLINYGSPWFKIETENEKANSDQEVMEWLDDSSERMHAVMHDPDAGLTTALSEVFLDLGCFGTAGLLVEEDDDTVVRFEAYSVRNLYVAQDWRGRVDKVAIKKVYTARQIADNRFFQTPDAIRQVIDTQPEREYVVIRLIQPREDFDPSRAMTTDNMPYESLYILNETKDLLAESGYRQFPMMVPRWSLEPWEIYGRSPGIKALASIKQLNKMQADYTQAAEKRLNPPLDVPRGAYYGNRIRTFPKAINFRVRTGNERIEMLDTVGDLQWTLDMIQREEDRIREMFYVDQLQLAQGPNMTAFEVAQRTNEKLRLMSPMLGRMQQELLSPMIDRVFLIMQRRGQVADQAMAASGISPAPEMINGLDTKIRYVSKVGQIAEQEDAEAINTFMSIAIPFSQVDPSVMDEVNMPEATKVMARALSVPPEIMRSEKDVQEIRARREQQAQAEQQKQDAERMAKTARDMSMAEGVAQAPVNGGGAA